MPQLPIALWANSFVSWMSTHLAALFLVISGIIKGADSVFNTLFVDASWILMLAIFVLIALAVRGWSSAVATIMGGLLIQNMSLWTTTMSTLALVITSGIFALAVGIPLGIWAGQTERARTVIRPILDFMQTMPPFVYLIPAVLFFSLGAVPAVFATFVFAVPPVIRLTELGLRQVPSELVEAGEAFGATTGQLLVKIKLPQATPSILAGVNQTIMLALSMVVIAGMIGAGGLGGTVLQGISTLDAGLGFTGGLAVVLMAIYLDRMTERLGQGGLWISSVIGLLNKSPKTNTF